MPEIVLDITTRDPKITRQRRYTPRLVGEQFEEIAAERYRVTVTVTLSPIVSAPSSASPRRIYVPGWSKMTSTVTLPSAGNGGANQTGAHGELAPARVSSHDLIWSGEKCTLPAPR